MSLRSHPAAAVPEETARVARAAFPQGNAYLLMRDTFGPLFEDTSFADLFAPNGRPAEAPGRLALVTLLQFAENLSDQQAAAAVQRCLDWKYLLGLELTDPGFHPSLLCDFRSRLLAGSAEGRLFEVLLTRFREHGLLHSRGRQRTDSTHVLAAVRVLNRLETVGESLRHALDTLAVVHPEWLRRQVPHEWADRYARPFTEWHLPRGSAAREQLALTIGADGEHLLAVVTAPGAPVWLREVPAVETLRQVWLQQYRWQWDPASEGPRRCWRTEEELPPAPLRINSPHDPDARYGKKGERQWLGYKIDLTETCEPDQPHLITAVETVGALAVDSETLPRTQAALQQRNLLPAKQWVDAGYVTATMLVQSQECYGVELVGPALADTAWQARAGAGFAAADFEIHWQEQRARCPGGRESVSWGEKEERGRSVIQVRFAREDCAVCPHRTQCTRAASGRRLTLRPEAEHRALQAAREREQTPEFTTEYGRRAGIEGTHSQGVRQCGLRRSRYRGYAKTHLQHLATAAALNFLRVAAWLREQCHARTRGRGAFGRLLIAGV